MQQVWFLLKTLEAIMSGICLSLHVMGLDKVEPIPHVMFYCGTYFAFTLLTTFGSLGILLGRPAKPLMEAIINGTGALMFILASLLSMYHAERDFHLMYLSDFEEPQHAFFRHCKQQSIASLITGLLFLLHCTFAVDICWIRQPHMSIFEDENEEALQPMKLYFISESVEKYLEQFQWFRRMKEGETEKKFSRTSLPLHKRRENKRNKQNPAARVAPINANEDQDNFPGTSSLSTTSLNTSQIYDKSEIV
ncbi:uncharacterized protein [Musca autumnalis]|uniref:uncharacterized protein n=1 Tax=Musca autumnalis TaxID=221902 RepID=UPI003CF2C6C1